MQYEVCDYVYQFLGVREEVVDDDTDETSGENNYTREQTLVGLSEVYGSLVSVLVVRLVCRV